MTSLLDSLLIFYLKKRDLAHPLVHSPDALNSQGWTRAKLEPGTPCLLGMWQGPKDLPAAYQGVHYRELGPNPSQPLHPTHPNTRCGVSGNILF